MYSKLIKPALRNFVRNKVFTLINLSGLAIGMGVCMLILFWIQYELSYNGFHRDRDRIAAVMTNQSFSGGETSTFPAVPSQLAPALIHDMPFIETAATTSWGDQRQFSVGDKNFIEYGLYVSPEFLNLFSFPLLSGDPEHQLTEPHTILISEKLAKKYFNDRDPVGQVITIEQNTPCKVTGVLKDVPPNATLSFDFLMPVRDYIQWATGGNEQWDLNNMRAYVKLKAGSDIKEAEQSIKTFIRRYIDKQPNSELMLFYLKDWYLKLDFKNGRYAGGGKITYQHQSREGGSQIQSEQQMGVLVNWFAFLALFISVLGLLGLTLFTVERKTKEIGIRKVLGAHWSHIVHLLSREFIVPVGMAGVLAIPLGYFLMNKWLGGFAFRAKLDVWIFVVAGLTALLITLITISVQAIRAAAANPIQSLRTE